MVTVLSNLSDGGLTPEGLRALAVPRSRHHAKAALHPYQSHRLTQRLGAQVIKQAVQRYQQGESATRIASDVGVSPSAFLRLIRDEGTDIRRRGLSPDQVALLASEYEGGATMAELEARHSLSHSTLQRALARAKITKRPTGRPRTD